MQHRLIDAVTEYLALRPVLSNLVSIDDLPANQRDLYQSIQKLRVEETAHAIETSSKRNNSSSGEDASGVIWIKSLIKVLNAQQALLHEFEIKRYRSIATKGIYNLSFEEMILKQTLHRQRSQSSINDQTAVS